MTVRQNHCPREGCDWSPDSDSYVPEEFRSLGQEEIEEMGQLLAMRKFEAHRKTHDQDGVQCPRCGMFRMQALGEWDKALSRLTRDVPEEEFEFVCSQCGHEEGMQQAFGTLLEREGWADRTEAIDGQRRLRGIEEEG